VGQVPDVVAAHPIDRVLADALAAPDVVPVRLFTLLWPLWRIDFTAFIVNDEPYDTIDHFVSRAVVDGGIRAVPELAAFLSLDRPLVQRVVAFLAGIGHLTRSGDTVTPTELGRRSVADGVRHANREFRRTMLFDQFSAEPLPGKRYANEVTLSEAALTAHAMQFDTLFSARSFQPDLALTWMERSVHAPEAREALTLYPGNPSEVYLPLYVVEAESGALLVYSATNGARDKLMQRRCRTEPTVAAVIRVEPRPDPQRCWQEWLVERGFSANHLRQLTNGGWRAALPAGAFQGGDAQFGLGRIGSFEVRRRQFVQLWCDEREVRRRAVLERGRQMVKLRPATTTDDLAVMLRAPAEALEVTPPSPDELRNHLVGLR
jgi:hypothetical protein